MADPKNTHGETIVIDDSANDAKHPTSLESHDAVAGPETAPEADPPLRTNRPDQAVVQRLGTGAGEHAGSPGVTDPTNYDSDGRYIGPQAPDVRFADEEENKKRQKEADRAAAATAP